MSWGLAEGGSYWNKLVRGKYALQLEMYCKGKVVYVVSVERWISFGSRI